MAFRTDGRTDRRSFIMGSGLTALASARAFGANDRLRVGIIGAGGRMGNLVDAAEKVGGYEIAAVCDVYTPHAEKMKARSTASATTTHGDYHEVLARNDVDAVLVATPDHWHVRVGTDAVAAGKDVYLEKPVTHTIEEGAGLIAAVRKSKRVMQCGMQQRSWSHFRNAVDLVQGGSLGRVTQVRTYWWQNYNRSWVPKPIDVSQLDWKQWLGGTPDQPFSLEKYSHWRWYWNFGGGAMTDLFAHWIDVVQWAMKAEAPTTAMMLGDRYVFTEWDCPDTIQAAFRYTGFDVVYEGMMSSSIDDGGLEFRGTDGTLKLTRNGMSLHREGVKNEVNPVLSEKSFEDGTVAHMANFFACVRSRLDPHAPVEAGVAAARAGHIGNMAYRQGGLVTWKANG